MSQRAKQLFILLFLSLGIHAVSQGQRSVTKVTFKHEETGRIQPLDKDKWMTFNVNYEHERVVTIGGDGGFTEQVLLSKKEILQSIDAFLGTEKEVKLKIKSKDIIKEKVGVDSLRMTIRFSNLEVNSSLRIVYVIRSPELKVLRNFCNSEGENTVQIGIPDCFSYNIFAPDEL